MEKPAEVSKKTLYDLGLSFIWPVTSYTFWQQTAVTQRILDGFLHYHKGIDIMAVEKYDEKGIAEEKLALASESGVASIGDIVEGGKTRSYGHYVTVDHTPNAKPNDVHITTVYGHLEKYGGYNVDRSKERDKQKYFSAYRFIENGQKVKKGQPIGIIGNSGNSGGVHLHFEFRTKVDMINRDFSHITDTYDPLAILDEAMPRDYLASQGVPAWKMIINNSVMISSFPTKFKRDEPVYVYNKDKNIIQGKTTNEATDFNKGVIHFLDLPYIGIYLRTKEEFNKKKTVLSFEELVTKYGYIRFDGDNEKAFINISSLSLTCNEKSSIFKIIPGPLSYTSNNGENIKDNLFYTKGTEKQVFIPNTLLKVDKYNFPIFLIQSLEKMTNDKYGDYVDGSNKKVRDSNLVSLALLAEKLGFNNYFIGELMLGDNISKSVSYSASKEPNKISINMKEGYAAIYDSITNKTYLTSGKVYEEISNIVRKDLAGFAEGDNRKSDIDLKKSFLERIKNQMDINGIKRFIPTIMKNPEIIFLPLDDLVYVGINQSKLINLLDIHYNYALSESDSLITNRNRKEYLINLKEKKIPLYILKHIGYLINSLNVDNLVISKKISNSSTNTVMIENLLGLESGKSTGVDKGVSGRFGINPIINPNSAAPIETSPPPTFSTTSTDYLDLAISEFGDTDDSIMGDVLESIGEDGGDGRFACTPDLPATLQQATRELISSLGAEEFINTQRLI